MSRSNTVACAALSLTLAFSFALATPAVAAPPTADQFAKISEALPSKAPAQFTKPRRLLVFTLCKGYRHSSIECCAEMLKLMGDKTGAYVAVISSDPEMFRYDKLHQFDAVCFDNTTGELFDDLGLKKNLINFVREGGGVVGIHAATDCFYEWLEYGDMMGGYFNGHPWNENVTIKIDDPQSPINAAFDGKPFEVADEIYQFKAPYSRDKLHVLLSLDTTKTDMKKEGIHRTDDDFAVSWIHEFGKGRVFYCSLGHREDIFWNPTILKHYLAGIQYALGDLKADATPSEQASKPSKQQAAEVEWTPLFNGKDLDGWKCNPGSWTVENGELTCHGGGYIWTDKQYGDFVLQLEFKVPPKGNSGVFFRTSNTDDPVQTGIEVQILDSFGKAKPDKHDCGAVYDIEEPSVNAVHEAGEWNRLDIACRGDHIATRLNGTPLLSIHLDEWTEAHKNPDGTENKFNTAYKDMPRVGYIGLQDHGAPVSFRNIRIRTLSAKD